METLFENRQTKIVEETTMCKSQAYQSQQKRL